MSWTKHLASKAAEPKPAAQWETLGKVNGSDVEVQFQKRSYNEWFNTDLDAKQVQALTNAFNPVAHYRLFANGKQLALAAAEQKTLTETLGADALALIMPHMEQLQDEQNRQKCDAIQLAELREHNKGPEDNKQPRFGFGWGFGR